jgi:hypothetical protein
MKKPTSTTPPRRPLRTLEPEKLRVVTGGSLNAYFESSKP